MTSFPESDLSGTISRLFVYPVKSCAGVEVQEALLTETGLDLDRAWMVVDAQGVFLTQRALPRMALIRPQIKTSELVLRAPGMLALHLAVDAVEGRPPSRYGRTPCLPGTWAPWLRNVQRFSGATLPSGAVWPALPAVCRAQTGPRGSRRSTSFLTDFPCWWSARHRWQSSMHAWWPPGRSPWAWSVFGPTWCWRGAGARRRPRGHGARGGGAARGALAARQALRALPHSQHRSGHRTQQPGGGGHLAGLSAGPACRGRHHLWHERHRAAGGGAGAARGAAHWRRCAFRLNVAVRENRARPQARKISGLSPEHQKALP